MGTRGVHMRLGQSLPGKVFRAGSANSSSAADVPTWRNEKNWSGDKKCRKFLHSLIAFLR